MVGKRNYKFCTAVKRALAKFGYVPIADGGGNRKRSFAAVVREAKAALHAAVSFAMTRNYVTAVLTPAARRRPAGNESHITANPAPAVSE